MKSSKTKPGSMTKDRFLAAFRVCGSIRHAAKAAGVDRGIHYTLMQSDPDYPAEFAAAKEEARDFLIQEARRRAVAGDNKAGIL